jgi:hypothetical protein
MQRLRSLERLRPGDLASLPAGEHHDGGGLFLRVEASGARSWVLRLGINGRRSNRGLGPYPLVTIKMAREQAFEHRRAARDGRDLSREKRLDAAKATTVRQAFDAYFAVKELQLSNAKHRGQWSSTMETYVFPTIGKMPVAQVNATDVIRILQPIWVSKAETAKRVLQRMRAVFNYAYVQGWRLDDPCRGVVEALGGTGHREVKHHPAMPYIDVPTFIQFLRACPSAPITKLAFEWLILTATRSAETREARAG